MQCFYRGFGLQFQYMAKIVLEKVVKELKLIKLLLHLRIGGRGYPSTKLLCRRKSCYHGQ